MADSVPSRAGARGAIQASSPRPQPIRFPATRGGPPSQRSGALGENQPAQGSVRHVISLSLLDRCGLMPGREGRCHGRACSVAPRPAGQEGGFSIAELPGSAVALPAEAVESLGLGRFAVVEDQDCAGLHAADPIALLSAR